LKLTTNGPNASRGLSATAELLVFRYVKVVNDIKIGLITEVVGIIVLTLVKEIHKLKDK